ncbi:MAG: restriction endonuclease [Acidimicrobiaceae bacterium]|nr:restriction endonuclease [Chloroflexota bacterium]MCY3948565.1 restriction endonuclease [Acidimicrobiaceae bacterium]
MASTNRLPDPDGADFDWEDYEALVKDVYAALGRAEGVTIECWGRKCKVQTVGGVLRQVDVLTRHGGGRRTYRTAISCKWWNTRVGVAHVSDFALILQDASLDMGIIVSKMGFTKPAQALAAAKGIGLVVLRKPLDADWEGSIKRVCGEITYEMAPRYSYNLSLTKQGPEPAQFGDQGSAAALLGSPERFVITEPGETGRTLLERVSAACPQPEDGTEFVIEFPAGTKLALPDAPEHPADGACVHEVSVQIQVPPPMISTIDIDAEDRIYMIMESVFDGTRYNITDDGEIVEVS